MPDDSNEELLESAREALAAVRRLGEVIQSSESFNHLRKYHLMRHVNDLDFTFSYLTIYANYPEVASGDERIAKNIHDSSKALVEAVYRSGSDPGYSSAAFK